MTYISLLHGHNYNLRVPCACGRSKGVFIETVEERKAAAEARKNKKFDGAAGIYDIRPGMPPPPMSFKYVRVPCDDSVAFEEIQGHGYDACDNFLEMLKPQFAGGNVDSEKAQRAAMQHLGNSVPTLGDKGLSTLTDAAEDGAVETFALVKPASSNKHTGVYIYLDEVGMLKGLPPNRRAAGIAKTCGFDDAQFFGDVFIGRVQITPSPMHNIDFWSLPLPPILSLSRLAHALVCYCVCARVGGGGNVRVFCFSPPPSISLRAHHPSPQSTISD